MKLIIELLYLIFQQKMFYLKKSVWLGYFEDSQLEISVENTLYDIIPKIISAFTCSFISP